MATKELRKMSRLELMEIIYLQQQTEKILREENAALKQGGDQEKKGGSEFKGTIPEVVENLDKLFSTVQQSSAEYAATVRVSLQPTGRPAPAGEPQARLKLVEDETERLLEQAREQAREEGARLLTEVRTQAERRAEELLTRTRAQAEEEREQVVKQAVEDISRLKAQFLGEIKATLKRYPELAKKMREG